MDNVTHTLVGATLGNAGLEEKTLLATPALLLAVNLPDIDIFGAVIGQNYLDFHRGITHSLPGVGVLSLALAAVFWLGSRMSGLDPAKRVRFLPMLGVCLIGVLSNPALDLLNDYGSRPWLPFSNQRYYGDLLSIADFWLWIIFGAGVFVLPSTRIRGSASAMAGVLAAGAVLLAGGTILVLVWLMVLGGALGLSGLARHRGVNPARAALVVTLVYLACLYLARERVVSSARQAAPGLVSGAVEHIDVLPGPPGSFGRWTVILQTEQDYYLGEVGLQGWPNHLPSLEVHPKNLDDPCYRRSLGQSQMAAMARFARFPCVTTERSATSCTVYLSDLRWARRGQSGWGVVKAEVLLSEADPAAR